MGKSQRKAAAESLRRQQAAKARRKKIVFGIAIGTAVVLIGGSLGIGIWLIPLQRMGTIEVRHRGASTALPQIL